MCVRTPLPKCVLLLAIYVLLHYKQEGSNPSAWNYFEDGLLKATFTHKFIGALCLPQYQKTFALVFQIQASLFCFTSH